MITLRLEKQLEKSIETIAKSIGITKSDLIRRSIKNTLSNYKKNQAWLVGQDIFGNYGAPDRSLSINSEKILRKKIKNKFKK